MATQKGEWIIPFRGRGHSGIFDINFLWRCGRVYVMDNHRAAMWCWLRHIDPIKPHSLLHIDRHFDTGAARLAQWLAHLPQSLSILTIDQYLDCSWDAMSDGNKSPVINWGNYLSLYLARYGEGVKRAIFATHRDGDEPNHDSVQHGETWELPENVSYWLDETGPRPWILNFDVDYCFWNDPEAPGEMFSDDYLQRVFRPLGERIENGTIGVATIALTPVEDLTGGWGPSENVAARVLRMMGIEFSLPE
jgi:hypothetical protein